MKEIKELMETHRAELSERGMMMIPNHDMENIIRIFVNEFINEEHMRFFIDKLKGHDIEIKPINPQVIDIVRARKVLS